MPLESYYLIMKLLSDTNDTNGRVSQMNVGYVQSQEQEIVVPEVLNKLSTLNSILENEVEKVDSLKETEFNHLKLFINKVQQEGFSTYDLTNPSGVGVRHINYVLEGTGLEGLGEYYIQAEKDYGVNAFFLVGLSALESAWGNSRLAQDRNNIFGFMAYDRNVDMAKRFDTKGESILHVAKYLKENYLTVGGKYYNGVTVEGVNVRYSSDKNWNKKISLIVNRLVYDLQFGIDNGLIKE